MKYLLSTCSHLAMSQVVNLNLIEKAQNREGYKENMKLQQDMRYREIFAGIPFQPIFS